jgi:hypothetical protein
MGNIDTKTASQRRMTAATNNATPPSITSKRIAALRGAVPRGQSDSMTEMPGLSQSSPNMVRTRSATVPDRPSAFGSPVVSREFEPAEFIVTPTGIGTRPDSPSPTQVRLIDLLCLFDVIGYC